MTAEFARFRIRETLSLRKYQREYKREYKRWLRLGRAYAAAVDNPKLLKLMEYWIDNNGAYLLDDSPIIDGNGACLISSTPVIDGNGAAQQVADIAAPTQVEENLGTHEMRAIVWSIIVIVAGEYFIFGVPIKDQLASWGFGLIVVSLIWPWLGPWLQNPAHCRLLGWLALAVSGLGFLAYWVGVIP